MGNLKLAAAVATIALSSMAFGASASYRYARVYRAGSQFDYTLATRVEHNGKPASTSVAFAHDLVVSKAGVPFDEVTFTQLKECAETGTSTCKVLDAYARQVPPFFLSLAADGSIAVPHVAAPQMTGSVTDLVTYWVAMSAKMGIANLHKPGDHLLVPTPISGNWANGASIPLGRDYLAVTEQLLDMTPDTVTFRSSFQPPPNPGLSMAHAWMRAPVAGATPNNFEQVIDQGNAGATVMWGHEAFTILTTVDRNSGVILRAQMENNLELRMRIGCTADATHCGPAMPFTIARHQTLRMLPAPTAMRKNVNLLRQSRLLEMLDSASIVSRIPRVQ